jgi:hypothetical protein
LRKYRAQCVKGNMNAGEWYCFDCFFWENHVLLFIHGCKQEPEWEGARENVKSREIQAIFCTNLALFFCTRFRHLSPDLAYLCQLSVKFAVTGCVPSRTPSPMPMPSQCDCVHREAYTFMACRKIECER